MSAGNSTTLTPIRMFQAATGRWFLVRVIPPGGRNRQGSVAKHAGVEFFDATHADDRQPGDMGGFGPLGQFVSAYYLATLLGLDGYGRGYGGLDLYGGSGPEWQIDEPTMNEIRAWLRPLAADYGEDKQSPPPSLGRPAAH